MKITLEQLRKLEACSDQVELFKSTFGDSVELTEEVVKEHGTKFDIDWLANEFLNGEKMAEYHRQTAQPWEEYRRQNATLWAEYQRQKSPLWAKYKRQIAPLWSEYDRQHAPLWAKYKHQNALIFWEIIK